MNTVSPGIRSIREVPTARLLAFYNDVFSDRSCRPSDNWEWLYRVRTFEGRTSLAIEHDDRVIAHAGMIPFWLSLHGRKVSAGWYVDLAVRPELQRSGLGRALTLEWMKLVDIHVTFCNERSMSLFRKMGWVESFDTRVHYFFLKPLSHPAVLKRLNRRIPDALVKIVDTSATALARAWYGRQSRGIGRLDFAPVSETLLEQLESAPRSGISPVRDGEYLRWRFLESPYRSDYSVVILNGAPVAVVKERSDKPRSRHVDLLLVKDGLPFAVLKSLIARLGVWAAHNRYAYLRYYESDPERSRKLQRTLLSFVQHPRFAFFSTNPELMDELTRGSFSWQLADSDFETTG